ncbi:hypothetical protein OG625_04820 [Streptomyces sp. NBC_01351]|uniref:hypothetical protein n=1 Tax=Streptomyces sp. NBC_01351 TaxID=2903833 RepID=UPI002E3634E3|nr:hypothetical protein [Streptomyces sp. NBC_01351]
MPLPQPHPPRSHRARRRRPGALSLAAAALVSTVVAARAGALTHLWEFLDFGAGVLSLVSLTATVLWGLMAADRAVLGSGHRLLAQGVHRGLAVAGLGFLALHIWVKVAEGRTGTAAAAVPFADGEQPFLIGLGTLAGYLFVAVAVSGGVRSAFATRSRSLWWRALHLGAYPAWGASLVHGLKSGRPAGAWVTTAYALCLVGVAAVLVLRLKSTVRGVASPPIAPPADAGKSIGRRIPVRRRASGRRTSLRRAAVHAPRVEELAGQERWR